MADQKTIRDQVTKVKYLLPQNVQYDLDAILTGISRDPMAFPVDALNRLAVLSAAIDTLITTCRHTLEMQRSEARINSIKETRK